MSSGRLIGRGLVLTCEHAGNRIPRSYAHRFRTAARLLASHRGWDPGALTIARALSRRLHQPLLAVTWSRLFVEANRSPSNPRIWSPFMRDLRQAERDRILARWWWPHRRQVEAAVARIIARGRRVVHIAVHSFTPELDGEVRNADVSWLYDSRRRQEAAFCRRWATALSRVAPALRLRHNYPYRGSTDGLTTWLRRSHTEEQYLGIELEFNQALVGSEGWRRLPGQLAASLREVMADT